MAETRVAFKCPEHDRCVCTIVLAPDGEDIQPIKLKMGYDSMVQRYQGVKPIATEHATADETGGEVLSMRFHLEERVARLEAINNMTRRGRRRMEKVKRGG